MKVKLLLGISLLFIASNFIYAQVTFAAKEEKVYVKPPGYDSTKTFEEQYTLANQYQFIGLQLFLPPVINPEIGPIAFSKKGSDFEKGNRSYTITDILKGNAIAELKQKKVVNLCGYKFKDLNSSVWQDMIIHAVFVLKDNNKHDTLNNAPIYWVVCENKQAPYCSSYFNSFISNPYFEKQKQLFQNQAVIKLNDKSKWLCKEVTLLKSKGSNNQDSTYDVMCLLKNDKGEQLQLRPPSEKYGRSFITEKQYIWLDHANRNEKEELIKAENERVEKHKTECISKFGQRKGALVAQNKIEVGMTEEMCQTAWGMPWDISKTKTSTTTKELWFYNWKYNLYFENKVLVKIAQ
jgi:hypothetical protein